MTRISDETLLTSIEVALAVAPAFAIAGLSADDPRLQRRARLDLARHLADRIDGLVGECEQFSSAKTQAQLFPE